MHIKQVRNRADLKSFLSLPQKIYPNKYPNYIAPLNLHIKMMLGNLNEENKYILIAEEDGKTVARIAAKIHGEGEHKALHFGFFECIKGHKEAAKALVEWCQAKHPERIMRGPYHFRMEDPFIGTMISGFDTEPYFLMPYNPEYYDEYLQYAGLQKAEDLLTYDVEGGPAPKRIRAIAKRISKKGATVRWLNPKNLDEEVRSVADIFNEALSENWGFEPITQDQLDELLLLFKHFIDPRTVCFLCKDGRDIGCVIILPNFNSILKDSNGKISPSLIWKLWKNKNKIKMYRAYALGLRKSYQGSGYVCQLIDAIYSRGVEIGIKGGEVSWVLESNQKMKDFSVSLGGKVSKVYRVYEKPPIHSNC